MVQETKMRLCVMAQPLKETLSDSALTLKHCLNCLLNEVREFLI